MTILLKLFLEMLERVVVFGDKHPQYFPQGSASAELIRQIEAASQKLAEELLSQRSRSMKSATRERTKARQTLRNQILALTRTARVLQMEEFWMPRDNSDRAMIQFGKLFAANAVPLRQGFVDANMPPDFIEQMNGAAETLEKAVKESSFCRGTSRGVSTAVDRTRKEANTAVKRLDALMRNLLQTDPAALDIWASASRIEKRNVRAVGEPPTVETGVA